MNGEYITARPAGVDAYRGVKPQVFEAGRVCEMLDCTTVLSKYNRAEMCYLHQPKKYLLVRGERKRKT